MVERVLYLALSFLLASGSPFSARALYHCATTGKKNQPACCCRADTAAPSGCPSCRRASPCAGVGCGGQTEEGATAGGPAPPVAPGQALFTSSVRSRCCSITYERAASPSGLRSTAEQGWKKSLADAREVVLAAVLLAPPPAGESPAVPGRHIARASPAPPPGPPLYLVHRILLI